MGTSYRGVYFFGCVPEDEEGERWAPTTQAAFDAVGVDDFDDWIDIVCECRYDDYHGDYDVYSATRRARMIERFGCELESSYIGLIDYAAYTISPKDAHVASWRGGRVPEWTADQIAHWSACMERVRAALPGLSAPGLWYGCSVG